MKKTLFMILVLSLVLSATAAETYFTKGSQVASLQVGINSYAIPFGGSFEFGVTENIGVAVNVMVQMWSEDWFGGGYSNTLITPSVEGAYHFNLDVDKLDLFAGAGLGYSIYSWKWKDADLGDLDGTAGSSLFLSPFAAARYYFSEKTAVMLKLYFSAVGDFGGVGAVAGISFKLK